MKAANRAYLNLWRKASPLFGAQGSPPPQSDIGSWDRELGGDSEAYTAWTSASAPPTVYLSKHASRRLTAPRARTGAMRGSAKSKRIKAQRVESKRTLLHEWAHAYQTPEALSDPLDRELAANTFALKGARRLGLKNRVPKSGRDDVREAREYLRKKHGTGYVMRGQFGSNYGADPTTLTLGR